LEQNEGQTAPKKEPILTIKGLKKYYPISRNALTREVVQTKAVDGVDLTIYKGETLGLVGESGCGKSTIGKQIVGLERPTAGQIIFQGQDIVTLTTKQLRPLRTKLQMVFQDSFSSLNPRKHISEILADPMLFHGIANRHTVGPEVDRLLELVGLPKSAKERYPHEFSGGQRQRIGIARALSLKPELIVCDEPVSALDVSIQAQILNLFKDLQKELDLTYLFIGHGLGAVRYVSDRLAVMYLGKIVELTDSQELFRNPAHPYTQAMFDAIPLPDPEKRDRERIVLQGDIPSNAQPPEGCRFHTRCPYAQGCPWEKEPELLPVGALGVEHLAACHRANPASGVRMES